MEFFCQQFIIYIVNRCFMCFYRKILQEKKNIKLLFGDFQKKKISIHHSVSRIILGNIMEHVSKYFWNTFSPKFLLLHLTNALILDTYNNTSMYFYVETVRTYTYLGILLTGNKNAPKLATSEFSQEFIMRHTYFSRNRYWTCDLNILTTLIKLLDWQKRYFLKTLENV